MPSISLRKHYRLVPGTPSEPTSTLVLTSQNLHFVDIRIFNIIESQEKPEGSPGEKIPWSRLDWAFAGTSHTTRPEDRSKPFHTVWVHWIDSKTSSPDTDEGDMYEQPNGDVLERGVSFNTSTGEQEEYEELWGDLDIETIEADKRKVSLVLQTDDTTPGVRGMVIRIGGWCQGILKTDKGLTVERWRWNLSKTSSPSRPDAGIGITIAEQKGDVGHWERVIKLGDGSLPCTKTFSKDLSVQYPTINHKNVQWNVIESFYW